MGEGGYKEHKGDNVGFVIYLLHGELKAKKILPFVTKKIKSGISL